MARMGWRWDRCARQQVTGGLLAAALVAGCGGATAMREDLDAQRNLHTLSGAVTVADWDGSPIVVALIESADDAAASLRIYDFEVLDHAGASFSFLVDPPRRLRLVAFEDTDDDTTHDAEERIAFYADASALEITGGGRHAALDLRIDGRPPALDLLGDAAPPTPETRSLYLGDVRRLTDPRFDAATGRLGLAQPLGFMRDVGAGIFFLEPYDPSRAVVLFVHGISGYPQEFTDLVADLDTARYQAWVAQYPTGFELDLIADRFDRALDELELRHHPRALCVVAHSMGGLVMRDALARQAGGTVRMRVPLLVTLASPLGGHPGAALGVRMSPVVVPVWRSLDPAGDFVTHLYDHALASETAVALLFAFGTRDATGDGIVPLISQLRAEAEAEASVVRGFSTSHTGILRSDDARAEVYAALDAHCVP